MTKLTRDILARDVELKVVFRLVPIIMILSDPWIAGNLGEAYTHGQSELFIYFCHSLFINDLFQLRWVTPKTYQLVFPLLFL